MVKKVKKTTIAKPREDVTAKKKGHISIFKRTDGPDGDGIGFFSAVRKHFHNHNGFRTGSAAALIIATAVQHGLMQILARVKTSRAVKGMRASAILTEEEARAAALEAANAHELMYLFNIPPALLPDTHDQNHEDMLIWRTRRAEIATLKREKTRAARADAQEAAGAGKKTSRVLKKTKN
ncbi:MAG: hypothetical protein AB7P49_02040 [Bdellovibrionales bacterium]